LGNVSEFFVYLDQNVFTANFIIWYLLCE